MTLKEAIEFLEEKTELSNEDVCILTGVEMALKMIAFAEESEAHENGRT